MKLKHKDKYLYNTNQINEQISFKNKPPKELEGILSITINNQKFLDYKETDYRRTILYFLHKLIHVHSYSQIF